MLVGTCQTHSSASDDDLPIITKVHLPKKHIPRKRSSLTLTAPKSPLLIKNSASCTSVAQSTTPATLPRSEVPLLRTHPTESRSGQLLELSNRFGPIQDHPLRCSTGLSVSKSGSLLSHDQPSSCHSVNARNDQFLSSTLHCPSPSITSHFADACCVNRQSPHLSEVVRSSHPADAQTRLFINPLDCAFPPNLNPFDTGCSHTGASNPRKIPRKSTYVSVMQNALATNLVIPVKRQTNKGYSWLFKCVHCEFVAPTAEDVIKHICVISSHGQTENGVVPVHRSSIIVTKGIQLPVRRTQSHKKSVGNSSHHSSIGPQSIIKHCPISIPIPSEPICSIDLTLSDGEAESSDCRFSSELVDSTGMSFSANCVDLSEQRSLSYTDNISATGASVGSLSSVCSCSHLYASNVSTISPVEHADSTSLSYSVAVVTCSSQYAKSVETSAAFPGHFPSYLGHLSPSGMGPVDKEAVHLRAVPPLTACCPPLIQAPTSAPPLSEPRSPPPLHPGLPDHQHSGELFSSVFFAGSPSLMKDTLTDPLPNFKQSFSSDQASVFPVTDSNHHTDIDYPLVVSPTTSVNTSDTDGDSSDDLIFMGFDLAGKTAKKRLHYCDECLSADRTVCNHPPEPRQASSASKRKTNHEQHSAFAPPSLLNSSSNNLKQSTPVIPIAHATSPVLSISQSSVRASTFWPVVDSQQCNSAYSPLQQDPVVVLAASDLELTPCSSNPTAVSSSLPCGVAPDCSESKQEENPAVPCSSDSVCRKLPTSPITVSSHSEDNFLSSDEDSVIDLTFETDDPVPEEQLLLLDESFEMPVLRSAVRKSFFTLSAYGPERLSDEGIPDGGKSEAENCLLEDDPHADDDPRTRIMVDLITGELFVDNVPLRELVPGLKRRKCFRAVAPSETVSQSGKIRNRQSKNRSKKSQAKRNSARRARPTPPKHPRRSLRNRLTSQSPSTMIHEPTTTGSVTPPLSPRVCLATVSVPLVDSSPKAVGGLADSETTGSSDRSSVS